MDEFEFSGWLSGAEEKKSSGSSARSWKNWRSSSSSWQVGLGRRVLCDSLDLPLAVGSSCRKVCWVRGKRRVRPEGQWQQARRQGMW